MTDKLRVEVRKVFEAKFGKEYLRDIHTGDSIDMSCEIDESVEAILSLITKETEGKDEEIKQKVKPMSVEELVEIMDFVEPLTITQHYAEAIYESQFK